MNFSAQFTNDDVTPDEIAAEAMRRAQFDARLAATGRTTPGKKAASSQPIWQDDADWEEADIAARPWIARGYFLRKTVTVISGASSVSKSTLAVAYSVALALHQPLGRFQPVKPCKVLIYGVEDDQDEQRRRFSAVLRQFGAKPRDLVGKVVRVGPHSIGTLIGRDPDTRAVALTDAMVALQGIITEFQPDVLILDPLVELHTEEENDNTSLRSVMAQFRTLAMHHNMSVAIVHHARKGASQSTPGDTDTLRGASSIAGAARIVLTVAAMTEPEGAAFGFSDEQRRAFFRVDSGKSNYSRLHEVEWFERTEHQLDNGDLVAAPTPWQPPQEAVCPETRVAIELGIERGSLVGPWSAKLSGDARSVKNLLVANGITTAAAQKICLSTLAQAGYLPANFRNEGGRVTQGLRAPSGQPRDVRWVEIEAV